jgi:hypothetical protein
VKAAAAAFAFLVAGSACQLNGTPIQSQATPKPSASATTASPTPKRLLFAVLQSVEAPTRPFLNHDTVLILALDGTIVARASFQTRKTPNIGNAAPLLQPEARTAAGKVFYADGAGAVRALAPDGTTAPVTTFPITSGQQELAFAVSPDGSRIWATVLHLPALKDPPPGFPGDPFVAGSHWFIEVLSADAGGASKSLYKTDLGTEHQDSKTLSMVGWDSTGPVVTTDTGLGTQNVVGGRQMFGHASHLDAAGKPGPNGWGTDCYLWAVLPDGTGMCGDRLWKKAGVRSAAGSAVWSLPDGEQLLWLTLAPDGAHATSGDASPAAKWVFGKDGSKTALAVGFNPYAWLDKDTIIGRIAPPPIGGFEGNLAYIKLSDPGKIIDLGLKADFAGVVSSP